MPEHVELPPYVQMGVSTRPRYLLRSDSVAWRGALFVDQRAAVAGSIAYTHERVCVWHNPAAFRARSADRASWQVVPAGVRVWVPGDEQRGAWHHSAPARAQLLFVTIERIEAILDGPVPSRAFAAWHGQSCAAPHITCVVAALCADLDAGSPSGPLAGDSLIVALVGYLAAAGRSTGAVRPGGLSPTTRRRLVEYIDAHLAEPLSLSDLAAQAQLSLRHLGRAFRMTMGESPHQYVVRQRVERARRLIEASHDSLAEIAGQAGFVDQSRLTNTFKRMLGVTPAQYRLQCRP